MPQENQTDWIEWQGGKCPVDAETVVQIKLGNSEHEIAEPLEAIYWLWEHTPEAVNGDYHITAYRIIPA